MTETKIEGIRLDIWLWRARFFKTRSLAAATVSKGRIRITAGGQTRRVDKPAALVRPGDRLTLPVNKRILQLDIRALGERRGPASEARALYDLIEPSDSEGEKD
jgi:ribosome-associated heat shock protein Hsp15